MWPLLLDMTPEESKRVLRRLELEAYSSIVSVFRAQGSLSKEKKKQLVDLQQTLSISTERHRAEVRRAINDEKLNTIADNTFGTDSSSEWLIEGRRLVPLMPRLVPQTAFTLTANQAANLQAERNAALPTPSLTGNKDLSSPPPSATPTMTATAVAKAPCPGSPTPNVVVLPSGVSVHIKEELDEVSSRRRSRSHSAEGVASLSSPAPLSKPHPPHSAHSPSPMKITISKSPQTKPQASITSTPPQKVILLSSSGQSTAASILQKSVSMPGVRGTGGSTTTHSSPIPKTSIIYPGSSNSPASNGNLGNIVTVATTSAMQNVSASAASIYQQGFATPTGCVSKPRQKTVTRTRLTTTGTLPMMSHRPGLVVPMGPQSVHGVTSHIKTVPGKPTIQIKQEGGMKIITQTLPSSKLLPKPSSLGSGSPSVVMVTSPAQTSTTGAVTMVTRAGNPSGSKILNITTQGGKVIATTNKNPNIVTVNPKTLHLTAVKTAAGVTGGKPNVIVVQKSHGKKLTGQGTTMVTTKSAGSLPFEKELVNFIQKHDPQKIVTAKTVDNRVILTTTAQDFTALKQKSRGDGEGKTSLLAELIQAASGGALSSAAAESHAQESSPREITQHSHLPIKAVTPALPANLSNEWFEYDVTGDVPVVTDQQKSQDIPQSMIEAPQNVTDPLTGEQYYTIEQAMHLVNQDTSQKAAADPVSLLRTPTGQKNLAGVEKLGVVTSVVPGLTPDLGDLDPQTGIFHSTSPVVVETKQPGQSMDLLSTSLAQAQIDLDPYQFMEDELVTFTPIPQGQEVKEQRPQKEALVSMLTGNVVQDPTQSVKTIVDAQVLSGSSSCGPPYEASSSQLSDHSSRASSFIPIQELGSKSPRATIHVTTQGSMLRGEGNNSVTVQMQPKGVDAGALTLDELTSQRLDVSDNAPAPSSPEIDLTDTGIGTSDSADLLASQTSSDVISSQPSSEFSSQGMFSLEASDSGNVSEPGSLSEHGNVSDGGMSSDSSTTRLGKRRRKPPSAFDDSPPAGSSGGWMRAALGLLNKVSKVRGSNRDRSGFDASSWFLYPVDPEDAPDYFTIIKQPMDFSTVKKKLETCQYRDFSDFNTDMLLVRENCNTYNPPGHQARQDCAEVFSVYHHEYLRLTEKLQKTRISSPNMKKLKLDKSPGKS